MKKFCILASVFAWSVVPANAVEVNGINFLDTLVVKPSQPKPNSHEILDSLAIHRKNAAGALLGMDAVQAVLNKPIMFHDGKMMVTYRFPDLMHVVVKVDDKVINANIMEDAISRKVCFDYRGKAKSYCSDLEYLPGKFTFREDQTHAVEAIVLEGIGK